MRSPDCPDDRQLLLLLRGSIPASEQTRWERHLNTCQPCQRRLEAIADPSSRRPPPPFPLLMKESSRSPWLSAVIQGLPALAYAAASSSHDEGLPSSGDLRTLLQPAQRPDAIGRMGPYDVVEIVGQGGMGIVLRAYDAGLDRAVALKVVRPELTLAGDARERFKREARMAAAIDHENVVTVHAVQECEGMSYLVMQFIDGESLAERLARCGVLDVEQATMLVRQLAAGLAAAHAKGIVHRDIKPANVLFEQETDRVKITDFGLAKAVDDVSLTRSRMLAGTPDFMSPEQIEGSRVDHRSDLFSGGSMLYTALVGQPPFRGESILETLQKICEADPPAVDRVDRLVPEGLARLIEQMMQKNPDDRIQSAAAVLELLANQSDARSRKRPHHDSLQPRPVDRHDRNRVRLHVPLLLSVGAVAIALVAVGFILMRSSEPPAEPGVERPPSAREATPQTRAAALAGFHVPATHASYATLAGAVEAAASGGVIEVHVTGTTALRPIRISGKSLTIRAAAGHRPVFRPDAPAIVPAPAITTDARLVLEGLRFDWTNNSDHSVSSDLERAGILANGGSLWIANCNVTVSERMSCVGFHGQICHIRNCELTSDGGAGLRWQPTAASRVEVNHSVFRGRAGVAVITAPDEENSAASSMHFERSTFTVEQVLRFAITRGRRRPTRVIATENVFDASFVCLLRDARALARTPELPSGREVSDFLRQVVTWSEQGNLYRSSSQLLALRISGRSKLHIPARPRNLADWLSYWGLAENISAEGTPSELSLGPVGADRTLVGSGEAYQRWTRTAEYRRWRAGTGVASH